MTLTSWTHPDNASDWMPSPILPTGNSWTSSDTVAASVSAQTRPDHLRCSRPTRDYSFRRWSVRSDVRAERPACDGDGAVAAGADAGDADDDDDDCDGFDDFQTMRMIHFRLSCLPPDRPGRRRSEAAAEAHRRCSSPPRCPLLVWRSLPPRRRVGRFWVEWTMGLRVRRVRVALATLVVDDGAGGRIWDFKTIISKTNIKMLYCYYYKFYINVINFFLNLFQLLIIQSLGQCTFIDLYRVWRIHFGYNNFGCISFIKFLFATYCFLLNSQSSDMYFPCFWFKDNNRLMRAVLQRHLRPASRIRPRGSCCCCGGCCSVPQFYCFYNALLMFKLLHKRVDRKSVFVCVVVCACLSSPNALLLMCQCFR